MANDDPTTQVRINAEEARATVEALYRCDSRRVFATLVRLLGDFDIAEEALHDAFRAALEQWPRVGVPANPRAWLVSTGRFKAIDGICRRARFEPLPDDVDALVACAVDAGAKITMPVADMFWGDRYGVLDDPFGHHWSVATHIRDVSPEEMQQAMQNMVK